MHYKSVFGSLVGAIMLSISGAAFAGGTVFSDYTLIIPVPVPDSQADYGIIDDTPIIKGGPIISDTPPNATAYIFVTPHRHGPNASHIYIVPDGRHHRWQPHHEYDWPPYSEIP